MKIIRDKAGNVDLRLSRREVRAYVIGSLRKITKRYMYIRTYGTAEKYIPLLLGDKK